MQIPKNVAVSTAAGVSPEWRELARQRDEQTKKLLANGGITAFRAGWLGTYNGHYVYVEMKRRKRFIPPPIEGHGIEVESIQERLKFQSTTGIRCLLVVIETHTNRTFYQWLDELEKVRYFDTRRGMRIYELTAFRESADGKSFQL